MFICLCFDTNIAVWKVISQQNYLLQLFTNTAGYLYVCLISCVFPVLIAEAESKTQQQLGELYDQVDKLQACLNEADAKLDNAKHEVCAS